MGSAAAYTKNSPSRVLLGGLLGLLLATAIQAATDPVVQAISLANPSLPGGQGGNNDSLGSVISADGRFVLFLSLADNLSTNRDAGKFVNVFLRNRTNNTTTLVSVNLTGTGGGNGHSVSPVSSTDGRYVAFESEAANLVVNDTNGVSDVFVRDLQGGTTILVSAKSDGAGGGNGASTSPAISADGRYVAFSSAATDLVSNDTNAAIDIFVRDLQTGTTTLASVRADGNTGGNGDSESPSLTPDGHWVAFTSRATNLVAGVTNNQGEIYARDLATGATIWASTNSAAIMLTITNATRPITSFNPTISSNGLFVVFKSFGAAPLLLRHNLQIGSTDLVSSNAVGTAFPDDATGPDMTPDGRFVAYAEATGSLGSYGAVYLWEGQTGTRTLVSANLNGLVSSNTLSDTPAVSADGRFVAFLSDATDLVTNAVDGNYQVYLRDTATGTTSLVSVDGNGGVSGDTDGAIPSITADGRYVAFDSFDGDYVVNDNNNAFDVFVRDMTAESTELISRADASLPSFTADGLSSVSDNSVSAEGRFVAFVSLADNLAANDTNDFQDVFVRDLQAGTNILVSVNSAGTGTAHGFSGSPVISSNGHYVAFVSKAGDLTANKTNSNDDIFVRDLQTGTTTLVSVSADGTNSGSAASSSPLISGDGRYISFYSFAKNLVPNDLTLGGEIFWRDTQTGSTISVSTNGRALALVSMSADGRYVADVSGTPGKLGVWDSQPRADIYGTFTTFRFVLSPDGRTLVFQSSTNIEHAIIAHDLVAGTDRTIGYSWLSGGPQAQVSDNGRFVAFVGAAHTPTALNGLTDVVLYDLQTDTSTLVSFNLDRTGSGNGPSDSPSISADGRFVAYRSAANDLVTGDNNNEADVFVFDRLTGTNRLISMNQSGAGPGNGFSAEPVISADGRTVVFRSVASDLVAGDLNDTQDVFVFRIPTSSFTDLDGDGMDDAWEMAYFGDLSHNGPGDSDGDGMSDLSEYKTGTDPMNSASRFSAQASVSLSTGQTTILWQSVPGRSYRVQYKDDINQTNWNNLAGGVGVNGTSAICVDNTAGASNQRFYRVALVD